MGRDALTLPAGQAAAALADDRVVALVLAPRGEQSTGLVVDAARRGRTLLSPTPKNETLALTAAGSRAMSVQMGG